MEKSLHLLKLLVPKMSEIVAKYCGGGVAGGDYLAFEYPGLLDAPVMCAATVDLAANWAWSIAVPFSLQAYLSQSCAPTNYCLPSLQVGGS